jgi:hypothetical protein
VKMPDGSFELRTPRYSPTTLLPAVWASKDIGPCALALFKNYQDHKDEILNKVFYGITAQVSHLEFAEILQKGQPSRHDESDQLTHGMHIHFDTSSREACEVHGSANEWCRGG